MSTTPDDIHYLDALELGQLISVKKLTCVDATRAILKRITELNPRLKAYELVDASGALKQAEQLDAELAADKSRGKLHGVPVAVKDLCDVEGLPTVAGMHIRRDVVEPAKKDAPVVTRLRAQGGLKTIDFCCFLSWPNKFTRLWAGSVPHFTRLRYLGQTPTHRRRLLGTPPSNPATRQPLGTGQMDRCLFLRLRRRDRCRPHFCKSRIRYIGLDPVPIHHVWTDGVKTDMGTGSTRWCFPIIAEFGSYWAHVSECKGLCGCVGCDCGI